MVDLKGQYEKIKKELDQAIQNVLNTTHFVNGKEVTEFSDHLKTYLNVPFVIPCGNGTDALQIALMALDLNPGDEVITTPFTFIATAEVIELLNLKPVFVDVNPDSFNMDVSLIAGKITPKTKVILPVHLFGQSCDMESIMQIAKKYQLFVIEDACQSMGSDFHFSDGKVQKSGTIGDIGCTSFFPSKNLGCFGDGGAIFTHNPDLATKCKMIANHGSTQKYYHERVGVNSRLDSIQAAILDTKLPHLNEYIAERQRVANYYTNHFQDNKQLIMPSISSFGTHTFHQYTLKTEPSIRDQMVQYLRDSGIPCMIYYPVPLHLQQAFQQWGYREGDFPISEMTAKSVLSLPIHTELSEEQLEFIVEKVNLFPHHRLDRINELVQ
jgi:UDP-2-acetamido-2-deoxy-ribo-hexuluronate aminotransferase